MKEEHEALEKDKDIHVLNLISQWYKKNAIGNMSRMYNT